jgi:hypothetical protein
VDALGLIAGGGIGVILSAVEAEFVEVAGVAVVIDGVVVSWVRGMMRGGVSGFQTWTSTEVASRAQTL